MINMEKKRNSAIEKLKKRGYDRVTVSGFSVVSSSSPRDTIEETYVLKQGNRGYMVSVEHSNEGIKFKDVILPSSPRPDKETVERLKKDIDYAFQNQ